MANVLTLSALRPRGRISFLAGSGISVRSGLLSGMMFNQSIAARLGLKGRSADLLTSLLITQGKSNESLLRFEQIIAVLRETIDPDLSILDAFDRDVEPNYLHYCLARAVRNGSAVFTPNFDSLIECAYQKLYGSFAGLRLACIERPHKKYAGFSFKEHWIQRATAGVFKLHGTLHIASASRHSLTTPNSTKDTVGATLDALGRSSQELRLEDYKQKVFTRNLKRSTLIVLGYSGLDEFDIVPSLAGSIHELAALYWISHESGGSPKVVRSPNSIPQVIRQAAASAHVPIYVIHGDTSLAFQRMFPKYKTHQHTPSKPTQRIAMVSEKASKAEALLAVARAAETASRQDEAQRVYAQVATIYRRKRLWTQYGDTLRRRARLLHVLGDHRRAERQMRLALHVHQKHRNRHGIAADLIQRAILLRDRGELHGGLRDCQYARKLYRSLGESDGVTRSMMEEATIRSLLGQVDRAIPLTEQALRYCNRKRRREDAGMCYTKLAGFYRLSGRLREALLCTQRAQRIHKMLGHTARLAQAYSGEAHCRLMMGTSKDAMILYQKSLKAFEDMNRRTSATICSSNIAIVEIARGRCEVALPMLKYGWRSFRAAKLPLRAASSCDDIALCYFTMGRNSMAVKWLRRGAASQPGQSGDSIAARLNTSSLIVSGTGDVESAWKANSNSLKMCRQHGLQLELIRGLYIRSILEAKLGKRSASLHTLLCAANSAKKSHFGLIEGDIYESLGDWYQTDHNRALSRRMFEKASTLFQKLGNAKKVRAISEKISHLS
jgi:tetratricopeptide (TPR) repeat protein